MQKEKEQQKPREELTLVFFPSSSLMLHSEGGREGGCKTEKWEKKSGRRGRREEGSHPPPFTSCTSDSHLVRRFLCTQCLVSFSFVSFTHSSFLSSLFIPSSFPQATYHIHPPYVSPLYTLPIPSLVTFSPSSTSLPWPGVLHFPLHFLSFHYPHLAILLCERFPSCITSLSPRPACGFLPPSYSFPCCCCPPPSSSLLSPPLPGSLRVPGLVKQCPHSPDINHRVPPIWATVCMWKRNMYAVNLKANVSLHSLTFKKESTCRDPRKARAKFVLMHT